MAKKETPDVSGEISSETIPPWRRNIHYARLFLAEDITALEAVEKNTPEEEGLAFRVATRIGNFSYSLREAYEQRKLGGRFPGYYQLRENMDGVSYYLPSPNEVRVLGIGRIRRRLPLLRSDFNSGTLVPPEQWGKDEELRGVILDKLMEILPRPIREAEEFR